jgi:hypothetical protein
MRIPRPRVTLRWLMVLVALVAIGAWGWRLMKLREDYQDRAKLHHSDAYGSYLDARVHYAEIQVFIEAIEKFQELANKPDGIPEPEEAKRQLWDAQENLESACKALPVSIAATEHYRSLARKYERLARYPWLPVEPNPPEPNE